MSGHCRGEVSYLEREIDSLKRAVDGERKKADDLIRERDLLNKLKTQAEHATHKQIDLIKINENTKRNLEQEMNGYKIEAQKQAKVGCRNTVRMLSMFSQRANSCVWSAVGFTSDSAGLRSMLNFWYVLVS